MESIGEVLGIVFLSTVKHTMVAVPLASGMGFSYLEVAIYTAIGGLMGLGFFMLFYRSISLLSRKWIPQSPKKVFSWKNKLIVRVKRSFGLAGIAFITPFLLSIPIGTIIACLYFKDKKKVFVSLAIAIVGWSFLGAALAIPLRGIL